jgi:hypothetical protein
MCGIQRRLPAVHRSAVGGRRVGAQPSGGSVADRQIAEVTASLLPRFQLGTVSLRRTGRRRNSGGVVGRQIAELATASSRATVFPRFRLGVVSGLDAGGVVAWLTSSFGGGVSFAARGDRNSG